MAKRRQRTPKQRDTPLLEAADGFSVASKTSEKDSVIALHEAAQTRYLNYALSVITARALPDVRDGLKPVQRRILYTMWRQRLTADTKPRKCAKVVGDVMGNYHPHGDSAIYDTLVRMAQPFSLRYPLVDGSGNFGSLDGDAAAAMRYTECRLATVSAELLIEIDRQTVPFRQTYDGSRMEPIVLPARLPSLLMNGATGIAVGMATNIPPHNLGEISTALLKLLDKPELSSERLTQFIKGPDFPTGGQITNTREELKNIYKTGAGTLRIRSTWTKGPISSSSKTIYITSIPYAINKSQVVERIADIVISQKLPALLNVKDVSADDVRVALELQANADERLVMTYLYRHTPLQSTFPVNLTCLVPGDQTGVGRPERLDLHQLLWHFLNFRLDVVTRRLEHELASLNKRIHILEGFEKAFDALSAILKIIRGSDGKADAAKQIIRRFKLDAEQTDAILELKIYRLAKLEIIIIRDELEKKRKRSRQIGRLLNNEDRRWAIVREEIVELRRTYGNTKLNPRRTKIDSKIDDVEFQADDFIVNEDTIALISTDGWIKRQKEVRNLSTTRLREGDSTLAVIAGSTRSTAVFFSNFGIAYSCRLIDIPATTGYGEPVQTIFKLKDGERIVAALSLDPRIAKGIRSTKRRMIPLTHAVAISSDGFGLRFSLEAFIEPSTRSGRRFSRLNKGSEIVGVSIISERNTILIAATQQARAMLCRADELNFLSGPGKGVILIRLNRESDRILGFATSNTNREVLTVETNRGASQTISSAKYGVVGRGGKGRILLQRGKFTKIVPKPIVIPSLDSK